MDRRDSLVGKAMNSIAFSVLRSDSDWVYNAGWCVHWTDEYFMGSCGGNEPGRGLIKAFGGRSKALRQQFMAESVLITVAGAVIGVVEGMGFGFFLQFFFTYGFYNTLEEDDL